jgi:hypothetical protein
MLSGLGCLYGYTVRGVDLLLQILFWASYDFKIFIGLLHGIDIDIVTSTNLVELEVLPRKQLPSYVLQKGC